MCSSENYHMKDEAFTYLRFPVGQYAQSPFNLSENEGILRHFNTLWDFISTTTGKGENVLIHCAAGKKKAGTTSVAWLMYIDDSSFESALAKA